MFTYKLTIKQGRGTIMKKRKLFQPVIFYYTNALILNVKET